MGKSSAFMINPIYWGFREDRCTIGQLPGNDQLPEDQKDIKLTKTDGTSDYLTLGKTCLLNIDGYFHQHEYDKDGLYLHDGGMTYKPGVTPIGLMGLTEITDNILFTNLTKDDVHPIDTITPWYDTVLVQVPDIDYKKEVVGLVFGGLLVWLEDDSQVLTYLSPKTLKLSLNRLGKHHVLTQLVKHYGVDKFPHLTEYLDGRIKISELEDIKTLHGLFDMTQTFLFRFKPKGSYHREERGVFNNGTPNRYYTETRERYPIRLSDGRYPSYQFKYTRDEKRNVLVFNDTTHHHSLYDLTTIKVGQSVYFNWVPALNQPPRFKHAYQLILTTEEP